MGQKRAIELFRTGEHTDSSGHSHKFTADHVAAIAKSYDKGKAPAPVVVGHPAMDAPAYGWVDGLAFNAASGKLDASLDLHDEMEQAITAKHFNRVSAAFFAPEHPSNPMPGSFYLRHVGLLGAAAPAVTGLKPFGFADNGEAHAFADTSGPVLNIEFALDAGGSKGVLEQLADALFAAVGKKTPATTITLNPVPNFTAPPASQENRSMMTDAEKIEFQAAKDRVSALEKQLKDSANTARTEAANTFADGLITAKKLDPARKAEVVATYMALAQTPAVEFAAADGVKTSVPALDAWKKTMEHAAPVLKTVATAGGDVETRNTGVRALNFNAPAGTTVDAESAGLHNKVLAYMAKHAIKDYAQALNVVQSGETV
jgi:hypothetical protein